MNSHSNRKDYTYKLFLNKMWNHWKQCFQSVALALIPWLALKVLLVGHDMSQKCVISESNQICGSSFELLYQHFILLLEYFKWTDLLIWNAALKQIFSDDENTMHMEILPLWFELQYISTLYKNSFLAAFLGLVMAVKIKVGVSLKLTLWLQLNFDKQNQSLVLPKETDWWITQNKE